ncbi:hypothetical protein MGALJ_37340 [Mycobacterium gallinarum]|uniref:Uncharacterized protein n=1 Tax=Mycobacterium gallinarum TaxID=39689 RepID=A0A9W4B544_9MYCO|nr:hypothetical protein MGALJ_37340 [Mycobacterium gallinarum]
MRAHRVDERLADPADARRFTGAAGENHLDVGAALGGGEWDRCEEEGCDGSDGDAEQTKDAGDHAHLYPLSFGGIQPFFGSLIFTNILPMFAPVNNPFMASTHDSMPS